jgi:hypothetical protein
VNPAAIAALAVVCLAMGTSGAAEQAAVAPEERVPAGTPGIARTTLVGQEIVDVPVTFLGVLEDALGPGYDLYLVRLEGEVGDHVGVAAGMSGSPVYVDDEIVGALGYRFGFLPKDAIGGVTPIEDMLDAKLSAVPALTESAAGVSPIATPVFTGGVLAPVRDYLGSELEEHGFVLTSAGSGGSSDAPGGTLEPGSPVGLELVRGDMSIAATGTVTLVDGSEVYVFGHPFLGAGHVEFPMTTAQVVHTLADASGSVKLAEVGGEVGAIVEDRLTAAVGRLGERASMMPVTVDLRREIAAREFRFEVVRHSRIAPVLVGAAVGNALLADLGFEQEATVHVTGKIVLRDLPELPFELALSSGGSHPFATVSQFVAQNLLMLYNNPFVEPEVEKVEIVLDVRPGRTSYRLETLRYDRGPVLPGSEIEIQAVLRHWRGETTVRTLRLRVPEGLPPGTMVTVAVGEPQKIEQALGRPRARRLASARDLASYVEALGEQRSTDRLEAVMYRSARGAVNSGEAYTALPLTAAHLLSKRSGSNNSTSLLVAPLAETVERLDGPVEGGFTVRFEIAPDPGREENR